MERRLKLIIAYDGRGFAGWQSQSHRNTIQDHIERAFERIGGKAVRVHGAGRTDAGVHALAQCAHVDVTDGDFTAARWTEALNALLPPAIRVLRCRYISRDFHARLSAKGKLYRYRIWSSPVLTPFEYGRAWHVATPFDLDVMKRAAKHFVGTHDFASFAANRGTREQSTIRTIHAVRVRCDGPCVAGRGSDRSARLHPCGHAASRRSRRRPVSRPRPLLTILQAVLPRRREVLGETESGSGITDRFIKSMRFATFETRR